jgi:pyruvate dehydrogenase E1 component alpha subunit
MNLAALWSLPVVFFCENNLYAMGTALARSQSQTDLALKAAAYNVTAWAVDGMDVLACRAAAQRAVDIASAGAGPCFVEFRTYRYRAHSMYDPELYRSKDEVELWKARDPIDALERQLTEAGLLATGQRDQMEVEIGAEIDDAVAFAEAGTLEPVEDLTRDVYRRALS